MFENTQSTQYTTMDSFINQQKRSKSPSIPVVKKAGAEMSGYSPSSLDEMRNEQMYDFATWRMFHRITSARRQQYINNNQFISSSQDDISLQHHLPNPQDTYRLSEAHIAHFPYDDRHNNVEIRNTDEEDYDQPEEIFVLDMDY